MGKIKNISQKLFLLVLIVAGALVLVHYLVFPQYITSAMWIVPAYYVLLYFVAFTFVLVSDLSMRLLLQRLMVFKTVKLLVTMAAMLLSVYIFSDEAKSLLIAFLVYYLLMMIPETLYTIYMKKDNN
ncbi:MAG: hypothetical protein IKL29_04755 [Bacteroidaceae bacterium]|nr:hypothetical protein [Bacteroidaceae bacterium]